ncbi:uncharacterized protein BN706_00812 [Clostridium sp. CAG:557]|nr:uncharacterized protein BN706_00812 [Clostridium sp. CAG:557]
MIKGVNKYVIEVSETGNVYYDKALLFVKPEYTDIECAILEKEAKKVLKNMDTVSSVKHHKKIFFGIIFLISAVLIGLLFSIIFMNIFAF